VVTWSVITDEASGAANQAGGASFVALDNNVVTLTYFVALWSS